MSQPETTEEPWCWMCGQRHAFDVNCDRERRAWVEARLRQANDPSIMQRLYDSEINATVSSFWDDGFYVRLGDQMNGYVAEGRCQTWADVEEWLAGMARLHYPASCFARGA